MARGQRKLTLIKATQVKKYVNERGFQITKDANYIIARHLEHHIEAILKTITQRENEVIRIKDKHIYNTLEHLYGNDRGNT